MNLAIWKLGFGGVSAASVLLTGGVLWLNRSPGTPAEPAPSAVVSMATSAPTTEAKIIVTETEIETVPADYCLLGEWDGQLATFAPDGSSLWQVYDVYINTLPPAEQTKLAAGIPVENETELENLLEDYTS